jgi:hypothetical protein
LAEAEARGQAEQTLLLLVLQLARHLQEEVAAEITTATLGQVEVLAVVQATHIAVLPVLLGKVLMAVLVRCIIIFAT